MVYATILQPIAPHGMVQKQKKTKIAHRKWKEWSPVADKELMWLVEEKRQKSRKEPSGLPEPVCPPGLTIHLRSMAKAV